MREILLEGQQAFYHSSQEVLIFVTTNLDVLQVTKQIVRTSWQMELMVPIEQSYYALRHFDLGNLAVLDFLQKVQVFLGIQGRTQANSYKGTHGFESVYYKLPINN